MTERLLDDQIVEQVRDIFNSLQQDVAIVHFTTTDPSCMYCAETRQLLEELAPLSDKIHLEVYDFNADADKAKEYNVDKAPATIIAAYDNGTIKNYGIRYFGIPSGHEFSSLIQDIMTVSERDSGLKPETREFLHSITEPVHLQVFVTPTCPYCPRAVVLTHRMALESDMVTADMIEAMEFNELSNEYGVTGVPHTDINHHKGTVIGAVPEEHFVSEIRRVLGM
jgi:glutaredoxin-like protein